MWRVACDEGRVWSLYGKAFERCGVSEALVGGEEREMLRLFAAEDEGGGELEGVGGAERVDAEEADGAGADFGGWCDFGPVGGELVEVTAGAEFGVGGQFTRAFASGERRFHFSQGAKPNNHVGVD